MKVIENIEGLTEEPCPELFAKKKSRIKNEIFRFVKAELDDIWPWKKTLLNNLINEISNTKFRSYQAIMESKDEGKVYSIDKGRFIDLSFEQREEEFKKENFSSFLLDYGLNNAEDKHNETGNGSQKRVKRRRPKVL